MTTESTSQKPFVGIVLARAPGYSESFLSSKIEGLRAAGFDVSVFVGSGARGAGIYPALGICKARPLLSMVLFAWAWLALCIRHPRRVVRFVASERALGRRTLRMAHLLAVYYPILMYARSGWLHFGFSALAVGAESLADAVGSRMGVSLRGYDVAIYPLRNPGSYEMVWQKVDKVHTISDDLMHLARRQGMPESIPVEKITPAIDMGFFRLAKPRTSEKGTFRLLTVARLHWKKGIEYTLMAIKLAVEKRPDIDWSYTIVGDGNELERLTFAAAEMGLSDRVTFAGRLEPAEVKSIYEQVDCYVQYSVQEGFCNAVLEAQAMELPCIVSDAEGLPENVGEQGVVVQKRHPKLLAAALDQMASLSSSERFELGRAARLRMVSKFSIERQRQAFAAFFELG